MKNILVIGGSNGLGCAITQLLHARNCNKIYILDKKYPAVMHSEFIYHQVDLSKDDLEILSNFHDVDTLIITAGIGRLSSFDTFNECEIQKTFQINTVSIIKIIHFFYQKLMSKTDFHCVVLSSISSLVSSPLFSLYAATKAAITRFIESINIELEQGDSFNRILNVCPGVLPGTSFYGGKTDFASLYPLAEEILENMEKRNTLFIPDYENIYSDVIQRYHQNSHIFGLDSYNYKLKSNKINNDSPIKIGYLSGTFDLFHIGHLNILYRAKEYCDYLIVGVHKDGSHKGKETFIPFDERLKIVQSIKCVDKVIESKLEDIDVYEYIKYHYLFVGSDYKNSDRFKKYEIYFKNTEVKIIYFPYTKNTSSTKLRGILDARLLP